MEKSTVGTVGVIIHFEKKLTAYQLYCIKLWSLKVLRNIWISSSDKFFITTHGEDEKTPMITKDISLDTYDLCDIIVFSEKGDNININIYYEGNKLIIPEIHSNLVVDFIIRNKDRMTYIPILSLKDPILNTKGDILPKNWVISMLPFLDYALPWILNNEGLLINFEEVVDYVSTSVAIMQGIIRALSDFYYLGYISNPSEVLVKNYGLVDLGNGLYKMENYDLRLTYASPVDFLLSREMGINTIEYYIGKNIFIRHIIAVALHSEDFIYIGDYLRIHVNNYSEIINIFRIVDKTLNMIYPDAVVEVLPMSSKSGLVITKDSVVYKTDDIDKPYYYSNLIYKLS